MMIKPKAWTTYFAIILHLFYSNINLNTTRYYILKYNKTQYKFINLMQFFISKILWKQHPENVE